MANEPIRPVASKPPKRRRWLRVLIGLFLCLLLLLVGVYFVGTSSAFLKGVILPKVSKSVNATITVSDASISPFRQVILHDLKVQTTGSEPLLTAAEARVRYNLRAIIGGTIKVDEVTVTSPTIQIIENADGTSNLDPLTKSKPKAEKAPQPSAPSKPPQVDVKSVVLNNATIRTIKNHKGGRDLTELSNVNVTLTDLKNGQTGKLKLSAGIKLDKNPPAPATNSALQAKVDGEFAFGLSASLKPTNIKGH